MEGFLNILRKLTGTAKENRLSGGYKDSSSPTGERPVDTSSNGVIDSFEYADNARAKEVGNMLQSGGYKKFLGLKLPTYPGSNTAEDVEDMGSNRMEYVPFAYTTTSDSNEPIKYGYIMRYGGDPVWSYGPNKIYGVTTDIKSYTADGAKKFFDKIKKNGGLVRLYSEPMNKFDIDKNTKSLQNLSDVGQPTKYLSDEPFGGGEKGAYLQPGLIEALREANRLNRGNGN